MEDKFEYLNRAFEQIKRDKSEIEKTYIEVKNMVVLMLQNEEYGDVLKIYTYLNSIDINKKQETRKLYILFTILKMEMDRRLPLMCENCATYDQIIEKLQMTVYALRRISACLSEESIMQASYYLQENNITYCAVFVILMNEPMVWRDDFCEAILKAFDGSWQIEEKEIFVQLMESIKNAK